MSSTEEDCGYGREVSLRAARRIADGSASHRQPVTGSRPGTAAPVGAESHSVRAGFEDIVRELRPDLYRYALWLCHDPALAEDVVQEALLRGWRGVAQLQDHGAIKQWLLTIVRREHARIYQRKRAESTDVDELSGTEQLFISTTDDTDLTEMRREIFRLEASYREPLVLQVLMGCSAEEIGEILGLKPGAVLTRLFRARKQLAARFK